MLRHACRRGLLAIGSRQEADLKRELNQDLREIIADYRHLWLARNRVGGLADSMARLEQLRADYV